MLETEADPQTLADLHWAEQAWILFEAHGTRMERWEAYCLVKSDRALVCDEIKRLNEKHDIHPDMPVATAVLSKLRAVRNELSSTAASVRKCIAAQHALPDTMGEEMALSLMMSSPKARTLVSQWTANPQEASARVGVIAHLVDNYRKLLVQVRSVAPAIPKRSPLSTILTAADVRAVKEAAPPVPPPPPAVAKAEPPAPAEPPSPPPEFPAELREDLDQIRHAKPILNETRSRARSWELLYLYMVERRWMRATMAELMRSEAGARNAVVRVIEKKIHETRDRHGVMMDEFRSYLERLTTAGRGT